jgi:hypothetical protein
LIYNLLFPLTLRGRLAATARERSRIKDLFDEITTILATLMNFRKISHNVKNDDDQKVEK